jgi:hypothetical protein
MFLVTLTMAATFMHLFTSTYSTIDVLLCSGVFLFYISDVLLLYLNQILKYKYAHIFVWLTYIPGIWLIVLSQLL